MRQLLHTLYSLIICALLVPYGALASEAYDSSGNRLLQVDNITVAPLTLDVERSAPRVEVRDGEIVPLCEYEQLQVFNVMGQEVRNEHLPAGVYLVRLVVQGETYTLKVVIR